MKRYKVPRVIFVNKSDRAGARPMDVVEVIRDKLRINAALVQAPIGQEHTFAGMIDLVTREVIQHEGEHGENVKRTPIAEAGDQALVALCEEKRAQLVERLADVDDDIAELFLSEEDPDVGTLKEAIRRQTIALNFIPVFVGTALKNKGVQPMLDGVVDYLPSPDELVNEALDTSRGETAFALPGGSADPVVALAFKLEEGKFGQLTYMRVYQGTLKRGMFVRNVSTGKRIKIPRLVRMHSDEMEDVQEVGSGEICAMFGVDCSSGDTFADASPQHADFSPTMMSMFVPEPVMSLAVAPKDLSKSADNFAKALNRFTREDPTLRVHIDPESKQTIISGMGELHLEIYIERMRREYGVDTVTGAPQVNYRETITKRAEFNYLHKKQTGGAGQFGRVMGYIEPLPEEADGDSSAEDGSGKDKSSSGDSRPAMVFENQLVGNNIPPEYIPAIEKGFREAFEKGEMCGAPVVGIRVVLTDGAAHAVDSSELAFRAAARGAFKQGFAIADPILLEPIMEVEVDVPEEYQGAVIGRAEQAAWHDQRLGHARRAVQDQGRRAARGHVRLLDGYSQRHAGQGRVCHDLPEARAHAQE